MHHIEADKIEKAFGAIEAHRLANNGIVTSEMIGYVASFGAAVIQSGLVAAVIFFSEESKDGDAKDRPKLIKALHFMMSIPTATTLVDHLRANLTGLDAIEEQLLDDAVALKTALRTFKKADKTKQTQS